MPVITPRGDGSFVISPGKPIREMRPQQAAKFLGVCKTRMYQMVESGLIPARRPSPGVIWVGVDDLERWKETTRDPEFWEMLQTANGR